MTGLNRILLVEDDPDIREILELSLGMVGGYTLSAHADVRSALAQVEAFKPQVILLDVMLPDMSGPEALPLFRANLAGAQAAIVFLTAKAGTGVRESYLALGAQDVLFKPFDPMALPDTLASVGNQHSTTPH